MHNFTMSEEKIEIRETRQKIKSKKRVCFSLLFNFNTWLTYTSSLAH